MKTNKKISASKKNAQSKPTTIKRALRAPRWIYWIAKDTVTLEQATALSLGLEPVRGLVSLLQPRKRRMLDYRRRLHALHADYGHNSWLPSAKTLPRLYRVRGVVEYAVQQNWDLTQNVVNALARMRQTAPRIEFSAADLESQTATARPQAAGLVEINVPTALRPNTLSATSHGAAEMGRRAELNLQRAFGALVLLFEKVAISKDIKTYLRGSGLNKSAVARALVQMVSEEEGVSISVTGSDQRAIEMKIAAALALFPTTAKSFRVDDGGAQDPADT